MEQLQLSYTVGRNADGTTTLENRLVVTEKVKYAVSM